MKFNIASKDVNINITKAFISSVRISFENCYEDEEKKIKLPHIEATVVLCTDAGREVTRVSLDTHSSWNKERLLDIKGISPDVFGSIGNIVNRLLPLLVEKVNGVQPKLEHTFLKEEEGI